MSNKNTSYRRLTAGFTLIDALIAVVVLATGILALTFLQVTMLRSGADARERSVAMTVAQNIMEERRAGANQSPASYAALANIGTFASGSCNYGDAATPVPPNATGLTSDYRYCVGVQRFRANGSTFSAVDSSGPSAPAYGGVVAEYKRLTVDVGWRNADGAWSSLRLGDALSAIPLINSNDLNNRPLEPGTPGGKPQVNYNENELTANTNFIPVAVGEDGTSVAATNPTPKVIGGGIAETSFQVFTYAAANGLANVQRQIDTRVVGCKCTSRAAPSLLAPELATTDETFLTRPVRASYWDGVRYTEPKSATYPTSVLIGREATSEIGNQSPYCDICCRDHHDPATGINYSGGAGEEDDVPRFDPYRTLHQHYVDPSADADANKVTLAAQDYNEVCRVIRVNGIYRVAQDPVLDHYAYLPTDNNAIDYTTSSVSSNYGAFVQNYIQQRVLPIVGYSWATNRVDVPALEDSKGLNVQAGSPIDLYMSDRRYLQNRAILLDVLGYDAKTAITECINQAGEGSPSDLTCALRHVSFASINMTELTGWRVERSQGVNSDPFAVSPKNFSVTTPTGAPVAGQVTDASGAVKNAVASAVATINRSISAVVDWLPPVYQDPLSTYWHASDKQSFKYVGETRPSYKITVNVTGLSYFSAGTSNTDAPYIGWSNASAKGDCQRISGTTQYTCDLFNSANAVGVKIRMANFHQQKLPKKHAWSCGTGADKVWANLPQCSLYRAVTFSGPGTIALTSPAFRTQASAGKPRNDEALASLGDVAAGSAYTVVFEASPSNPFTAETATQCDAITKQPIFAFQDGECRLPTP